MPSISGACAPQRGSTLIEALVAAALLGITAAVALTAWDAAVLAARRATAEAATHCLARAELEAILAGTWQPAGDYQAPPPVQVQVGPGPDPGLQLITVSVASAGSAYRLAAWKSQALSGTVPTQASVVSGGCPAP